MSISRASSTARVLFSEHDQASVTTPLAIRRWRGVGGEATSPTNSSVRIDIDPDTALSVRWIELAPHGVGLVAVGVTVAGPGVTVAVGVAVAGPGVAVAGAGVAVAGAGVAVEGPLLT